MHWVPNILLIIGLIYLDWWIIRLSLPIRSLQELKMLRKRMRDLLVPSPHVPFPKRFTLRTFFQEIGQKLILQSNFCLTDIIDCNFKKAKSWYAWLNYKIFRLLRFKKLIKTQQWKTNQLSLKMPPSPPTTNVQISAISKQCIFTKTGCVCVCVYPQSQSRIFVLLSLD